LSTLRPRLVLVTRKSPLSLLLDRYGTYGQVEFYLKSRGQTLEWYETLHARLEQGLQRVLAAIPTDQRRTHVDRDELDRFLFAPDDVIVVVGQDGLVPNVAKYLAEQLVIGVNPDPDNYEGVLCRHTPQEFGSVLQWLATADARFAVEARCLAQAEREDGQLLASLNEIFVGHQSHQSARYRLRVGGREERHSSSGVLIATGTGASGWVRSISRQRQLSEPLPAPAEARLAWFVREPFPSVASGTSLDHGSLAGEEWLELHSEMGEGGVVFGDGIESDRLEFLSGQRLRVGLAPRRLHLLIRADEHRPPRSAPALHPPARRQTGASRR
jgi:NAD kinase